MRNGYIINNFLTDGCNGYSVRKIQRSLCQACVYFAWNIESGQYRIIDFDLPVEIGATNSASRYYIYISLYFLKSFEFFF